jgi:hypothetical protein
MHFLGKPASFVWIETLSFSYAPLFFIAHFSTTYDNGGVCICPTTYENGEECICPPFVMILQLVPQ